MLTVGKENKQFFFRPDVLPAAFAAPEETVRFCCTDCYDEQITADGDDFQKLDMERDNPITGPLFIEGAVPGDLLRIRIQDIRLDACGSMCVSNGNGVYPVQGAHCRRFAIKEDCIYFDRGLRIPVRPMIGIIGCAPERGKRSTLSPGDHGGNMDIRELGIGSVLYAVPLDLELKPSGSVALELQVDYSSMEKVSDSTQVPVLDEAIGEDDQSDPDPDPSDPSNPGGNQGGSDGQGSGSGSGNQGGIAGGNGTQVGPGTAGTVDSGTLKAGTYTVSANIWFDKADTGLPLNPHITSSVFPPMNPVSNNATLTVDSSGRARVSVPITIQDKVMSVKSISGLNIVSSSSSGGKLTSITVDLGVIDAATSVITEIAEYFKNEIGYDIPPMTPFVGRNFNVTRAGIHADGLLKDEEIYNIFTLSA